jgi:NAD-dependent dihydropyrimidine dehydrogenase PreA subunit
MTKDWYPIIDLRTCTECGRCIEKCALGVYDRNSPQTPIIICRECCKDGCHACGDFCRSGSISYFGDETGWVPHFKKEVTGCGCGFSGPKKKGS